jgi:L-lactate dehydrogenase
MKVGIVGSGLVGATAAYSLVMRGIGREVVLVDQDTLRAEAEAADIRHAVPFSHPLEVRAGRYEDLRHSRVVLLCAGVGTKVGGSRLELLSRNARVFREIVPRVLAEVPDAVIVVATNPVDVMTHLAASMASTQGWGPGRVLGSGTTLDTARFRSVLGLHCGVDARHVHGDVIGEHGDSELFAWSLVTVAGMPLAQFARLRGAILSDETQQHVENQVRKAAIAIKTGKGSTCYGIGCALAHITGVILHDQRSLMTVCAPIDEILDVSNVTLSLPRLVGGTGVMETFRPSLSDNETALLRGSAKLLGRAIAELDTKK